jgi:2-dehydro-3-deoxy-D-gluconate 5-dehydrogenase
MNEILRRTIRVGGLAAIAVAVAACGSSKRIVDGLDPGPTALFTEDVGTAAQALAAGETLETERLTAGNRNASPNVPVAPGFAISRNDDGGVDVTVDGTTHSFTDADQETFGWQRSDDGDFAGVFSWNGQVDDVLDENNTANSQIWSYFLYDSDADVLTDGFAVVGTQTTADAVAARSATAEYRGYATMRARDTNAHMDDRTDLQAGTPPARAGGGAGAGRSGGGGGRRFAEIKADFSDPSCAERVVEETVSALGGAGILVNNAGVIRRNDALDFTESDWDEVMTVNIKSVFFLSQAAAKRMVASGGGKIINIASMLSFQGGIRVASYTSSKSGVAGLTKLLANEWASKGINVNAIAPGYFATNNTEALRADEKRNAEILSRIPAGRWGDPKDLGGAAVFLASDASLYVHGTTLAVDGGWLAR